MKFGSSFYNLRKKGVSALFEEIQNIFQFEASWQIAPKRLLLKTLVVNSKNLEGFGWIQKSITLRHFQIWKPHRLSITTNVRMPEWRLEVIYWLSSLNSIAESGDDGAFNFENSSDLLYLCLAKNVDMLLTKIIKAMRWNSQCSYWLEIYF